MIGRESGGSPVFDFARLRRSAPAETPVAIKEPPVPATAGPAEQFIRTIRLPDYEQALAECDFTVDGRPPAIMLAFISPYLDFPTVTRQIKQRLPGTAQLVAVSTAGELSADPLAGGPSLYCAAIAGLRPLSSKSFRLSSSRKYPCTRYRCIARISEPSAPDAASTGASICFVRNWPG